MSKLSPDTTACDGPDCDKTHKRGTQSVAMGWLYLQGGAARFDFCGHGCLVEHVASLDEALPLTCGECRHSARRKQRRGWALICRHPWGGSLSVSSWATKAPPATCPLQHLNKDDDDDPLDSLSPDD